MLKKLIFLFIVIPVAEMYILLELGSLLGIGNTILLIIATGIIGSFLYRSQSQLNMRKIWRTVEQGMMPNKEMFDQLLIVIGAVFLMTPGIMTDLTGFLLLIPLSRQFIRKWIKNYFKKKIGREVKVETYSPP